MILGEKDAQRVRSRVGARLRPGPRLPFDGVADA
jgi:hypothetical protein